MPKNKRILDGFAMTSLSPASTGLPCVVFIYQNLGAKHDVRLQIGRSYRVRLPEMLTMEIRPTVRVIAGQHNFSAREVDLLKQWVGLNRVTLIQYWDREIEFTEDVLRVLKPIDDAGEPPA